MTELEDDVAEMIHHLIVSSSQMEPTEACRRQLSDALKKLIDERIALPEKSGEPYVVKVLRESVKTSRSVEVILHPADCAWLLRQLDRRQK